MTWVSSQKTKRQVNRAISESYRLGKATPLSVIMNLFGLSYNQKADEPVLQPSQIKNFYDVKKQLIDLDEDVELTIENAIRESELLSNFVVDSESFARKARWIIGQLKSTVEKMALLRAEPTLVDTYVIDPSDPSIVNKDATSAELDYSTDSIRLNKTVAGVNRLVPERTKMQSIKVLPPQGTYETIPGSMVHNLFADNASSWGVTVNAPLNTNGSITAVFKVFDVPKLVNEIAIDMASQSTVAVLYSNDGKNFFNFGKEKEDVLGKATFTNQLVNLSHIKVSVSLPNAVDKDRDAGIYIYNYVINSIGLFSNGYDPSGRYQTQALEVSEGVPISNVSIDLDADIPEGTDVKTYVSVAGNTLAFDELSPRNLPTKSTAPKVLTLRNVDKRSQRFTIFEDTTRSFTGLFDSQNQTSELVQLYREPITLSDESDSSERDTDYSSGAGFNRLWKIDSSLLSGSTNIRNAKLLKGIDGWLVTERASSYIESISRQYAEVEIGESLNLFKTVNETIELSSATRQIDTNRIITEATNINGYGRPNIFASIRSLTLLSGTAYTVEIEKVRGETYLVPTSGTPSESTTKVRVQGVGYFDVVITNNKLKVVKSYESSTNKLISGRTYTLNIGAEDVSRYVSSVNGTTITIDPTRPALSGKVEVVYNSPLLPNEVASVSSVSLTSTGSGNTYNPGTQFTVSDGGILSIPTNSAIDSTANKFTFYLDFEIETSREELTEYSTWLYVNREEGVELNYTPPSMEQGEGAFINGPGGYKSVIENNQLTLQKGAHKLTVISKEFSTDNPDPEAALVRIIQLVDDDGDLVFGPGKYFDKQLANIDPAVPVGLFEMNYNVKPNDDSVIGLTQQNDVILNYDPVRDGRILTLTSGQVSSLLNGVSIDKRIKYEYNYDLIVDSDVDSSSIVIRCDLSKTNETESTPVINRILVKCR